jgi:ribonuclease HI
VGRGPGARREGRPQGGRRAPAPRRWRGRHGRDPEALSGLAGRLLAFELALARLDASPVPGGLADHIDDEFEEVGASGRRWDREAVLVLLAVSSPADVAIDAFDATPLSRTVALVTYRSVARGPDAPAPTWRSSVWVRRGDRWRLRFHQGTHAVARDAAGG